jgi:hypothetical protein
VSWRVNIVFNIFDGNFLLFRPHATDNAVLEQ